MRPVLRPLLSGLVPTEVRPKHMLAPVEAVLVSVSRKHGVSAIDVANGVREKAVVVARHEWIRLVKDSWNLSLSATARLVGFDHTTVIYAVKKSAVAA